MTLLPVTTDATQAEAGVTTPARMPALHAEACATSGPEKEDQLV